MKRGLDLFASEREHGRRKKTGQKIQVDAFLSLSRLASRLAAKRRGEEQDLRTSMRRGIKVCNIDSQRKIPSPWGIP